MATQRIRERLKQIRALQSQGKSLDEIRAELSLKASQMKYVLASEDEGASHAAPSSDERETPHAVKVARIEKKNKKTKLVVTPSVKACKRLMRSVGVAASWLLGPGCRLDNDEEEELGIALSDSLEVLPAWAVAGFNKTAAPLSFVGILGAVIERRILMAQSYAETQSAQSNGVAPPGPPVREHV